MFSPPHLVLPTSALYAINTCIYLTCTTLPPQHRPRLVICGIATRGVKKSQELQCRNSAISNDSCGSTIQPSSSPRQRSYAMQSKGWGMIVARGYGIRQHLCVIQFVAMVHSAASRALPSDEHVDDPSRVMSLEIGLSMLPLFSLPPDQTWSKGGFTVLHLFETSILLEMKFDPITAFCYKTADPAPHIRRSARGAGGRPWHLDVQSSGSP